MAIALIALMVLAGNEVSVQASRQVEGSKVECSDKVAGLIPSRRLPPPPSKVTTLSPEKRIRLG